MTTTLDLTKPILEAYLLKAFKNKVETRLTATQDAIKALIGPSSEFAAAGLVVKTSKEQSRKTFDSNGAQKALAGTKYSTPSVHISLLPGVSAGDIPDALKVEMSKYFRLETVFSVTKEDAELALSHGQIPADLIDKVFVPGKPFVTLNTPTKISDKELAERYSALVSGNVIQALLEG